MALFLSLKRQQIETPSSFILFILTSNSVICGESMETSTPFLLPRKTPLGIAENVAEWATGLKQLNQYYLKRPIDSDRTTFVRYALESLGIDYQLQQGSVQIIPQQGSTLIVANHPLGGVEGIILAELLLSVRADIKILANEYLKTVPELDSLFIGVDVFESQSTVKANAKAVREAHHHLAEGGLLLVFPAGEVSTKDQKKRLVDKSWNRSVSRFIRRHEAVVVPIFINGENSKKFYLAGKIHPLLRTVMLGREMLNKRQQCIGLAIGEAIHYSEVKNIKDDYQLVNYLRLNTYLLGSSYLSQSTKQEPVSSSEMATIHPPISAQLLAAEIAHLPHDQKLIENSRFDVYCTTAADAPHLLKEIGRVREVNFRAVGEGTGKALDLDRFDDFYYHLFVWDKEQQQLVGAYRLGASDQIIQQQGIEGLYSRTLFNYDKALVKQLGKSLELGRSFVAQPYQRSLSALLFLWKGICEFVYRHPQYTHLFGPVSISNDYSLEARQLLAASLEVHHYDQQVATLVKPSYPLPKGDRCYHHPDILAALTDIQLLSKVVSRLDNDNKGVPVLLRQYLGLNGKLLCFNVDPAFNDALDGLIVVDLRQVAEKTLAKYMGLKKTKQYIAYHR